MAEWEETANSIKPMINENSLWKQIGYMSKDNVDCEPILLSSKHEDNIYPIVVETPTGLNNPKYDWTKHMWVDQDATSNSVRLTQTEKILETVQNQAESISKENEALKDSLSNIEKGQKDQTQTLAQVVQMMAPLLTPKKNDGGSKDA